jgi:hypothetical protein
MTSKDAVNMVTTKMTEQEVPEQSLAGTLSEGHLFTGQRHIPETSQDVPEQDAATPSLTQSGLLIEGECPIFR